MFAMISQADQTTIPTDLEVHRTKMIRRDTTLSDGRLGWVLINQTEHARVAGELAAAWGRDPFLALASDEVLPTVFRHDDGWAEWERQPGIDPEHARPFEFLEMPPIQANEIWRRSIDHLADLGPLSQYMVASHFVGLRRKSDPPPDGPRARFITEFDNRAQQWYADWQAADADRNVDAVADLALRQLQFFDSLSLWLCCADRSEPHAMTAPCGRDVLLTPVSGTAIAVSPWPFIVSTLDLSVPGRAIPAGDYESSDDLASAPCASVELYWQLSA